MFNEVFTLETYFIQRFSDFLRGFYTLVQHVYFIMAAMVADSAFISCLIELYIWE